MKWRCSASWKEWKKANLLKDFTSIRWKVEEKRVDHAKDRKTNFDSNLEVKRVW
jgi:hypothetical protein